MVADSGHLQQVAICTVFKTIPSVDYIPDELGIDIPEIGNSVYFRIPLNFSYISFYISFYLRSSSWWSVSNATRRVAGIKELWELDNFAQPVLKQREVCRRPNRTMQFSESNSFY
jgi:hypothetical protein